MNNFRPLLTFGTALVVVVIGFWAILGFASHYNRNLTHKEQTPTPTTQTPPPATPTPAVAKTPAPTPTPPVKVQTTPQPTTAPTPSPSAPKAATPTPATVAAVPETGPNLLNTLVVGVGASTCVFLLLTLRRQAMTLRPNR